MPDWLDEAVAAPVKKADWLDAAVSAPEFSVPRRGSIVDAKYPSIQATPSMPSGSQSRVVTTPSGEPYVDEEAQAAQNRVEQIYQQEYQKSLKTVDRSKIDSKLHPSLANTDYAAQYREAEAHKQADQNAQLAVQQRGYSPDKYKQQLADLAAKQQQYVDVPFVRDVQLGLRATGETLGSLGVRGLETLGAVDKGTADYAARLSDAPMKAGSPGALASAVRGATHALSLAYIGGTAAKIGVAGAGGSMGAVIPEAAEAANTAGSAAAFIATGANEKYTQALDAGKTPVEAAGYAVRGGMIDGLTAMLFPAGKAASASTVVNVLNSLQHTAPVLLSQTGLAQMNDRLSGLRDGPITEDDFVNLAANTAVFSLAGGIMQSGGTERDAIKGYAKEIRERDPKIPRAEAFSQATKEVTEIKVQGSQSEEPPNVVVDKSAAGNPFGVDITDSQPRTAETPSQEAAAASESPRPAIEAKPNVVSPEPPEDLNERLRQRIKDAQAKPSPEDVTSLKRRIVDPERVARGDEAQADSTPQTRQSWEDEAHRRIAEDPEYPQKVLTDLAASGRAQTPIEEAAQRIYRVGLKAKANEAADALTEAYKTNDPSKVDAAKAKFNAEKARLERQETIMGIGGAHTEAGRALASIQGEIADDYSLIGMLRDRENDKERPLTKEEHIRFAALSAKIADLEKQVETMRANAQTSAADEAVKTVKQRVTDTTKPKPKKLAQRITETLDKAAADAEARMKARGFRALAGIPVEDIADMSIIAAAKISKGVVNVADFMVKTYGEKIRPHLREILAKAKERVEEHTRLITRDDVLARLKEKTAAGELGTITQDLRKIAEGVYHEGHQERDAMIDRVHEITKGATGLTRDKTAMAFSGLGQFRPITKQQSLEKLKLLAEGLIPPKTGMEREKFTETKKALEKKVRAEMKRLGIASVDPETQLASAIDRRIESLKRQTADYRERLAKNDFEPMNKKNPVRNDEIYKLEVELKHVKDKYQSERLKDKLAHRTPYEKIVDAATGYARDIGALSYPTVAGKLGAAAVARGGMTVAEDAVGAGLRRIAPNIAAKANVEGGPASRAQYAQAWKGVKEGYSTQLKQLWRNGKMDIDVLYGKNKDGPKSKFMAFWGLTHAMLKSGVKQGIFERTTQRLIEDAVRRGLDPHSPQLQEAIGIRAYQEANRSIFLQDNYLSNKVKMAFAAQVAKGEAHPSVGAKTLELVGKVAVPIVRVPTNIIAETFSHLAGAEVAGGYAAFKYFRGDIEKLTPEQANDIMRNLKKGVIGNAAVLLGYSLAGSIGGFYQRDKKLKGGLEPNTLAGSHGLGVLLHSPIGLAMQFGANLHHVMDKQGLVSAVGNSLVGTVENVPFVRETLDISRMLEASDPLSEFGVQMGKHFIPGIVQKTAEWTDRAPDRKAKGPAQRFEKMLPILRERLPAQNKQ